MPHRLPLIVALLLPFGLGACFFGPPVEDEVYPYGRPRYGHGGTDSPAQRPAAQGAATNTPPGQQGGSMPLPPPNQPTNQPTTPGTPGGIAGATNPPAGAGGPTTGPGGAGGAGPSGESAATSTEPPPYGIPVPGKDGMLYSPFKPDAGFIDITTRNSDGSTSVLPPGTKIKDPFSGKAILVP